MRKGKLIEVRPRAQNKFAESRACLWKANKAINTIHDTLASSNSKNEFLR